MQFATFNEFIHMGGHGFYIWLAYGISAGLCIALIIQPMAKRRRIFNDMRTRQRFENQKTSSINNS